jgi:hypothetical protein
MCSRSCGQVQSPPRGDVPVLSGSPTPALGRGAWGFAIPSNASDPMNVRHRNAFEQAALDPAIASRARKGEFVRCLDHFGLLQTVIS